MQHRTLGSQGLEVSAIGYGAMGLTMAYGPTDEEASVAAIHRAHDLGVTFFDTAEMYGWGTGSNEILVGKAVRDFRDDAVLATKCGSCGPRSTRAASTGCSPFRRPVTSVLRRPAKLHACRRPLR